RSAEVQNAKQRNSLEQNRDQILLSKQLVTANRDVPMEVDWQHFATKPPDRAMLMPLLRELEFTALIKEYLPAESTPTTQVVETDTLPPVGDSVFFDFQDTRVSFWAGAGEVSSVPLNSNLAS